VHVIFIWTKPVKLKHYNTKSEIPIQILHMMEQCSNHWASGASTLNLLYL